MATIIDERYPAIVILGQHYSGKTTQGKGLEATNTERYFHLSTGDMFRRMLKDPEIRAILDRNEYIPDLRTVKEFQEELNRLRMKGAISLDTTLILDGIPRTTGQVELIKPLVDVKRIIYLYCKDNELLIPRVTSRAREQGRVESLKDVRDRFAEYHELTEKILKQQLYPQERILTLDALDTILNIHSKIVQFLAQTI